MIEITIEEISRDLATYLHRAQIGESFVILQAGQPIAQINPATPQQQMTLESAIATFRKQMQTENLEIDPDEIWGDVRDRTPVSDEPRW